MTNLDYLNIAQLKALHRTAVREIKAMHERKASPRIINIQMFAEQHEFAIREQQRFLTELANRIRILEDLEDSSKLRKLFGR